MQVAKHLLFKTDDEKPNADENRAGDSTPATPPSGGGQTVAEKAPDGRLTATENELKILHSIERLGHATSYQIALMSGLSRRSVQRTLKRLQDRKMASMKRLPDGDPVYLMRKGGADELSLHLCREVKRTNDDLDFISSRLWRHRKLANDTSAFLSQHFQVLTEREIQSGRNPAGRREILPGKVPDMMIKTVDGWRWIEVERTWKKRREYLKLIRTIEMIMKPVIEQRESGPMLGSERIREIGLLATDENDAQRHIQRFTKHYNVSPGDSVHEHLTPFFRALTIMWWEGDDYREDDVLSFFYRS